MPWAKRGADKKIRFILRHLVETGGTWAEATAGAGYKNPQQVMTYWGRNYPQVQQLYRRCLDFAHQMRGEERWTTAKSGQYASPDVLAAHSEGLLYDPDRIQPELLGFADFRWEYLGFPTAPHHQPAVDAMEDMTNMVIFVFGPPGMGKDTLSMHYTLWRAPHREQTAFFMSSAEFAARRGRRIEGYLRDPQVYRVKPNGVPGGQVPTRSMIYDFGPFTWNKGMLLPDGTEVPRPIWNQYEKYYVTAEAMEQEPNLWFTGVGGATYGSRIQDAILSDLWPPDKVIGPDELQKDFTWVQDTLETRLDDDGRLLVLGTMLPWQNNYVRLINEYTDGAIVIDEDEYTQKWSNGVCVVKIKAITYPDGEPRSYWPAKFPLDNQLEVTDKKGNVEVWAMDDAGENMLKARALQADGKLAKVRARRGLLDRQRKNPVNFRAIYQQEDVTAEIGDFTDQVLDAAYEPTRTFGRFDPTETLVLGVDPAKTYGAAWWLWGVKRDSHGMGTLTLVDYGFHEALGIQGIKDRLVVEPIVAYHPAILAYEINRHEAIMEDQIIRDVLKDFGVKLYQHRTGGENRGEVGILATLMRVGQIRLPSMTKEDRQRLELVRNHFKAYDLSVQAGRRSRPGQKNHLADDIAFAAWIGSIPARELLEGRNRTREAVRQKVPDFIMDRWQAQVHRQKRKAAGTRLEPVGVHASGMDIATMIATNWNERT